MGGAKGYETSDGADGDDDDDDDDDVRRAILFGNLQEKCRTRIPHMAFCAPAQSKRIWTFHKSHFA